MSGLAEALLAAAIATEIRADFEGGSMARASRAGDAHWRIEVKGESDQDGRNRQASWYYFRVDGAPRGEMIFDITGLPGEYNYRPNRGAITADTPPVVSYDGKTWSHAEVEYDASEPRLRVRIVPSASRFWIAHTPPYTAGNLRAVRERVRRHPDARETRIGRSVSGRDLHLWTIGRGDGPAVWLMFRQHSWESGSSWAGEGAVDALLASPDLRRRFVWKIFPLCDPDGVARGGVRFNAHGYDLNRNWDATDARRMPEIAAQRGAIAAWIREGGKVALFLTLHNTETAEYLEGETGALGERLFSTLARDTMFDPSRGLSASGVSTTPGLAGRMSVVQGLTRDFGIPAFLMEQRIARGAKLGRPPSAADRLAFGRQLVTAITAALE